MTFNVKNAYVKVPSSYCSSSKSASGKFEFNIVNSIWESAGKFAMEAQSTAASVDFELKDSVFTTGSHLLFSVPSGDVVIDNSNVNVGSYKQFENCVNMTIKNGSVVYASVAASSNAKNPGTLTIENATFNASGEFTGSDLGIGTLVIKDGASFTATSITKANIVIDAANMTAGDVINVNANLSGLVGTLTVINNDKLEAKIVDGQIVLDVKPVAEVNGVKYDNIQDAFKAATDGCTIYILSDIVIDYKWDNRYTGSKFTTSVTIEGNGHTIKFTGAVNDGYNFFSVFRFESDAVVKNLTIDMSGAVSEFQGRIRAISAKASLTVDNCTFIGNGSNNNTRAIIFGEGGTAASLANVTITITGSTFEGWRQAISDNETGKTEVKDVVITGNTMTDAGVNVSAVNSIVFSGNTVEGRYVKLVSYAADNKLTVTAENNVLTANGTDYNYTNANTANVQDGFKLPAVAEIDGVGYSSLAEALQAARDAGLSDVVITLVGNTSAANAQIFDLRYATEFDSVTFKQADATKAYYINKLYTGSRNYGGDFIFDGVNIVVTGQYMFEGYVKLINNSKITSTAEANCFFYYATVEIEAGSSIKGVIDDFRGGDVIVDGGRTDGQYNTEAGFEDAIMVIRWSGDSLIIKNGGYVKINSANEVGRLTIAAGTFVSV